MIGEGIHQHQSAAPRLRAEGVHGRLFHRPHGLHRLQGLRGRVQGVERGARRRLHLERQFVRQHRPPRRLHLAARALPRAGPAEGRPDRRPDDGRDAGRDAVDRSTRTRFAGSSSPTSASTARSRAVSSRARPARSCARKSARCSCRTTCATAAATAWSRARLGVIDRRARAAAQRGRRVQMHLLLRPPKERPHARVRQGLPNRIDPVRSAHRHAFAGVRSGWRSSSARGMTTRRFTTRRRPRCAGFTRSSCCSASAKRTVCRRDRNRRLSTWPARGRRRP